jgi:hypothetical protein
MSTTFRINLLFYAEGFANEVDLIILDSLCRLEDDLDLFRGLALQMTNAWIELEFILVSLIPSELNSLVSTVN